MKKKRRIKKMNINLSSFFPSSFKKDDNKKDPKNSSNDTKNNNTKSSTAPPKKMDVRSMMGISGFGTSKGNISNKNNEKNKVNDKKRKNEDIQQNDQPNNEKMKEKVEGIRDRISPPRDMDEEKEANKINNISENNNKINNNNENNNNETKQSDKEDVDDKEIDDNLPVSHIAKLRGHSKGITALAMEKSGARLISGSYDMSVKYWDFNGMDRHMKSFRTVEPDEGHPINSLDYSDQKGRLLVATASLRVKIVDREGEELAEFIKGDQYLHDMANTFGHVGLINNALWHPSNSNEFLTSSLDGTVRLWDSEFTKRQKQIVKARGVKGTRVGLTYALYNHKGSAISTATEEGSLYIYDTKTSMARPSHSIHHAHKDQVTSICFSHDDNTLLTRSKDHTLKVWDVRKFKEELKKFDHLPNEGPTDVTFSPDGSYFLTGTSVEPIEEGEKEKGGAAGLLVFFDTKTLQVSEQLGMGVGSSVFKIKWHSKLNQIFCGGHDSNTYVLYDPKKSSKGALLCAKKKPRKASDYDFNPQEVIISPFALPLFMDSSFTQPKRRKIPVRQDPELSRIPNIPHPGQKSTRTGGTLTQYLMKDLLKKTDRDIDPREAILKYAEIAEKNPIFVNHAYQETQPQTIFDYTDDDKELNELKKRYKGEKKGDK
eukprot:TRINITY_DN602_c1_g2_i2.p1 TRINITY_DN602_c1_g2~~TRINITY_DN602_c1_g2_i2.p1  ORF type:complete len:657 (-),score=222.94 TRINITY_DN602_c1_g2_i2:40-2010(-)